MTIYLSNRIKNLPPRRILRDTGNAKLVLQCEFAISSGKEEKYLIKTAGFNSCLVLTLYSTSKKIGGLAHIDLQTDVPLSLQQVILPEFKKRDGGALKACLVGGLEGQSDGLVKLVRDYLKAQGINIAGIDVLNPAGHPGLIINARTGRLFDPERSDFKSDAEILLRFESALRYLVDTPAPRLIRQVG
jgi:hypothetical protein